MQEETIQSQCIGKILLEENFSVTGIPLQQTLSIPRRRQIIWTPLEDSEQAYFSLSFAEKKQLLDDIMNILPEPPAYVPNDNLSVTIWKVGGEHVTNSYPLTLPFVPILFELLRTRLGNRALFRYPYDSIDHVEVEYWEMEREEKLTLDRMTKHIVVKSQSGTGTVETSYALSDVPLLLDSIEPRIFYESIPKSLIDDRPSTGVPRNYTLSVVMHHEGTVKWSGCYDRDHLPPNWRDFIGVVCNFIQKYAHVDLFCAPIYTLPALHRGDAIMLSVRFGRSSNEYSYLTDDDSILPGDRVVVPVGEEKNEKVVTVVSKKYVPEKDLANPRDWYKTVLRKYEKSMMGVE